MAHQYITLTNQAHEEREDGGSKLKPKCYPVAAVRHKMNELLANGFDDVLYIHDVILAYKFGMVGDFGSFS